MDDVSFPYSADKIVATLARLFEKQNGHDVTELLRNSHARIEQTSYDNWNGGIYLYTLTLEIPIDIFSAIESKAAQFEQIIAEKITSIFRKEDKQQISNVAIIPLLTEETSPINVSIPDANADHLWRPKYLRLFLSHVAVHKVAVGSLKDHLQTYGVSAFVAHESIEPNAVWHNEIWKALHSMHAMAALLTPEFHGSLWTDQETGFALGRGVPVIPVRIGLDPYGFIGIHQGLVGNLQDPSSTACHLVDVLLRQEATSKLMKESLVVGLEESVSYSASKTVSAKISDVGEFTSGQLDRLEAACSNNLQVKKSFGVPNRIDAVVRRQRPISDDDLPF